MTPFYVSTLARYVIVDAQDDSHARQLGRAALHELFADVRQRLGREVPIEIHTVRPATQDEIDMDTWHREMVSQTARTAPLRAGP